MKQQDIDIFSKLSDEIKTNRKKFRVDHFDMVVSEYVNMYNENRIILNPPYQRNFRWSQEQQSTLIESILIGIPLPPIFVFSNRNYIWEVIDGLQRTTTLINFLNSTKADGDPKKGLFFNCPILKSLNGQTLADMPESIVYAIKNARIRIELVEDSDDAFSQYLLFSRLNNTGEKLSAQELRNFLIYKRHKGFYEIAVKKLQTNKSFKYVTNLPAHLIEKQELLAYVMRFFISRNIMMNNIKMEKGASGIDAIITKESEDFLRNMIDKNSLDAECDIFQRTYDYLKKMELKSFTKTAKSLPNTSVIAPAISLYLEKYLPINKKDFKDKVTEFLNSPTYKKTTTQSYSPSKRFYELSYYACEYFKL